MDRETIEKTVKTVSERLIPNVTEEFKNQFSNFADEDGNLSNSSLFGMTSVVLMRYTATLIVETLSSLLAEYE
jgi:hypothetical protein